MAKSIVVGGAGHVGSHVAKEAVKRGDTLVIDDLSMGAIANIPPAAEFLNADVSIAGVDWQNVIDPEDRVFWLASLLQDSSDRNPMKAFAICPGALVQAAKVCAQKRATLVFSSSASVYGNAMYIPMNETHPWNGPTVYAWTKMAGEEALRRVAGLKYVILRYMNVYGPLMERNGGVYTSFIWMTVQNIIQGKPPVVFGDGSALYDFVYVEDVARANWLATRGGDDVLNRAFNVGTGIGTSVLDVAKMCCDVVGRPDLKEKIEFRVPAAPAPVVNRIGSTEKARTRLGFTHEVGLRDGLSRLVEYMREKANAH